MGAIAPPKGCKKRKKERKEVIFYCFCAVFEASSGDRPPPKGFCRAGKLPQLAPRIHGTSSTTPPRNLAGKLHQLPPLEFTEPHRLPPPSKSGNLASGRKTRPTEPHHRLPPPSKSAGTEIRPPQIQFLDPPLCIMYIVWAGGGDASPLSPLDPSLIIGRPIM